MLQFWADDPETDVIAMYLETFGNPRKFSRIARTVGRLKPIIVLASETGAVGGSTLDVTAMEALRAHSGVIEVGTISPSSSMSPPCSMDSPCPPVTESVW